MWIDRIKISLVLCCLVSSAFMLSTFSVQGQQKPNPQPRKEPINYELFTHESHLGTITVPGTNHARILKCDSCHQNLPKAELDKVIVGTTDRNRKFLLKFPGHKACIECHVTQFTATPQQTCTICHQTEGG
jgi:Cytochrome c7 and related cytochrome c